jgi:hypothetical protein
LVLSGYISAPVGSRGFFYVPLIGLPLAQRTQMKTESTFLLQANEQVASSLAFESSGE